MAGRSKNIGLFEFLEEAELQQYYSSLKNILQVHNVQQLKYVVEDDLFNIGMSRPEARRLRTLFLKFCPQNYASKLKKLLRPMNKRDEMRQEFLLSDEDGISNNSKSKRYSTLSNIRVPSQHIIPADAIAIHKELGSGEFGVVQQGVWTDEDQMRHQVAIKCLSKERMQNNTLEFMKEYEIMQAIDHPNIVRLYGVVLDSSQQIMLITELAHLRSLLECLKEPSLRTTFTVPCLANFAVQICQGMKYLEAKRLIHRDLAARNILVFSKNEVKVSDFGLSRALGVGKDYYQTNFNVNLKLPIAWCAPECINFLKFTSASDVWAFGVTLWEMFSYGFQPWAAQTGQQILQSIDEPHFQRLEQPVHCPKEHYNLMLQTWRHDPQKRPTFEQLTAMLEDAKPEQVQAVNSFCNNVSREMLEFEVGDVITVLDKPEVSKSNNSNALWSGTLNNGRVGLFSPTHTVAYVGTLPSQGNHSKWQNEEIYQQSSSTFQRSSLRGSKGSRRKISRDMISGPRGDVHHTGHIGADGAYFGNVGGFKSNNAANEGTLKWNTNGTVSTGGKDIPFISMPSLTRADSDASERAPLISGRGGSTSSGASLHNGAPEMVASAHASSSVATANKNPRMGYAIGYLRKSSNTNQQPQQKSANSGANSNETGVITAPSGVATQQKHEYQTISDDEFGGPLDLGPSLMDEVFSELDSSKDDNEQVQDGDDMKDGQDLKFEDKHKRLHSMKDMKELVSSTLTLHKNKHKKKQQATVKPIKASDEKTLDNAIAMANALASKSMHDLDKRHLDLYDYSPPLQSPLTPNSPSKKFSFWFPGKATSPRGEGRHFIDEANNPNNDVESIITPAAKDAYKVLIEGKDDIDISTSPRSPSSPTAAKLSPLHTPKENIDENCGISNQNSNPLPLPPKSQKLNLSQPPKRHVRKNPLIISSGVSASLLRREGVSEAEHFELQVAENVSARPVSTYTSAIPVSHHLTNSRLSSKIHPEQISAPLRAFEPVKPAEVPTSKSNNAFTDTLDPSDAFENEIASSMDALDHIASDAPVESAVFVKPYNPDHVSREDLLEFRPNLKKSTRGKNRGESSDEVRIMKKVLGQDLDPAVGVKALDMTDWNVHHAIKLVKIKNLMRTSDLTDIDMKVALQTRDWDIAKAAGVLMKKIKE